jgi:hypothetical protein
MALKIKISIQYINEIASPDIRIFPSRASSARMAPRSASRIPAYLLNLLRSIFPPLLVSIQRTRYRVDCDGPILSHLVICGREKRLAYLEVFVALLIHLRNLFLSLFR